MNNSSTNEPRCTLQREIIDKIGNACRFILSLPNFDSVGRPEKPIDILTLSDAGGYKPIHYAIAAQNEYLFNTLSEIFYTFPYAPFYFNTPDREGNSPLHWAMMKMNYQAVVNLVRCGADVSKMNHQGRTPLHIASEHCVTSNSKSEGLVHLKMVKFLISIGAVVDAYDARNVTPLHTASEIGNTELIETLVQEGGAFVNAVDEFGETPLFYAIRKRHHEVVRKLLELKANIYAKNSEGETPLEYCMALRDHSMIDLLNQYQSSFITAISFNSPHTRYNSNSMNTSLSASMTMSISDNSNSNSSAMSTDGLSSSELTLDMSVDLTRSEEMNALKNNNNKFFQQQSSHAIGTNNQQQVVNPGFGGFANNFGVC